MSTDAERAGFLRKVFAVLCCAVALAAYVAVAGVFLYYTFRPVTDWVERQDGLVRVACKIVVGLGYLMILAGGFGLVDVVWKKLTHVPGTGSESVEVETDDAPRCPRCGFRELWDGVKCGHCRHTGRPWDHGARPGG